MFVAAGGDCWAVFGNRLKPTNAIFQHDRVSEATNVSFQHQFVLCNWLLIWMPQLPTVQCIPVVRPAVCLSFVCTLTPVLHDAISLYLMEGFQWNLVAIFTHNTSVQLGIAEVVKVSCQRSRSYVYKCVNAIISEADILMVCCRGSLVDHVTLLHYSRWSSVVCNIKQTSAQDSVYRQHQINLSCFVLAGLYMMMMMCNDLMCT